MDTVKKPDIKASPEQLLYARVLEKGMYFGLGLIIITFALYIFSIIDPYIPLDKISSYWSFSVEEYLHKAGVEAGWSWLGMVGYGDYLNFVPIVILAATTIVCYLAIVPTLLRQNDKVYAVLALLEAIILSAAASGILGVGGH